MSGIVMRTRRMFFRRNAVWRNPFLKCPFQRNFFRMRSLRMICPTKRKSWMISASPSLESSGLCFLRKRRTRFPVSPYYVPMITLLLSFVSVQVCNDG